jgi:hypothetical protein
MNTQATNLGSRLYILNKNTNWQHLYNLSNVQKPLGNKKSGLLTQHFITVAGYRPILQRAYMEFYSQTEGNQTRELYNEFQLKLNGHAAKLAFESFKGKGNGRNFTLDQLEGIKQSADAILLAMKKEILSNRRAPKLKSRKVI